MNKTILVLAVILLVSAIGVTAWGWYPSYSCSDTDGGLDYDNKGAVTYGGMTYTDRCVNYYGYDLKEYYCSYGRARARYYDCPNGCSDGACITQESVCGNGIKEGTETCDDGANNGVKCTPSYPNGYCKYCETYCNYNFLYAGYCGDGIMDSGYEQCDDGNNNNGDGCDNTCQYECQENWQCGNYGECQTTITTEPYCYLSSIKYRNCIDLNNCGTEHNKPSEGMNCQCTSKWDFITNCYSVSQTFCW